LSLLNKVMGRKGRAAKKKEAEPEDEHDMGLALSGIPEEIGSSLNKLSNDLKDFRSCTKGVRDDPVFPKVRADSRQEARNERTPDKERARSLSPPDTAPKGIFSQEGRGIFSNVEDKKNKKREKEVSDKKKKKSRRTSSSESSSEERGRKGKKSKKHRRRSSDSSGSKAKKHKKHRKHRSDSSGSASSEVFRVASSSSTRSSQSRLISWSGRHPGRLTAKSLQLMEDRVGRGGENKKWKKHDCPPCAKSYFLMHLGVKHAGAGKRNLKEMSTLCYLLDHMAHGRFAEASDMITQRLKAVEMSSMDGGLWDRANFLELVPEDGGTMTSREEQRMVQSELEAMSKPVRPTPFYEKPYYDYGKGKGKDVGYAWIPGKNKGGKAHKGKKGKNDKGKGKGKAAE
jgi:hypothetical protein